MISRRTFIQTAAAGIFIPQFAQAQSAPFVLPEQFIPQYVRVKDECSATNKMRVSVLIKRFFSPKFGLL